MSIYDKAFLIITENSDNSEDKYLVIAKDFKEAESLYFTEIKGVYEIKRIEKIPNTKRVAYPPVKVPLEYENSYDAGIEHVVEDILPNIDMTSVRFNGMYDAKRLGDAIIMWENEHRANSKKHINKLLDAANKMMEDEYESDNKN